MFQLYSHENLVSLFVLRFYSPLNPMGSCRAQSVYRTTLYLGRLSPLSTSIVHIQFARTDNCIYWISRRERMTVENISWSISTKECCQPSGVQTCNLLITSRTCIQLNQWGRQNLVKIIPLVHKILCSQKGVMPMLTPMGHTPKSICPPHRRLGDTMSCVVKSSCVHGRYESKL